MHSRTAALSLRSLSDVWRAACRWGGAPAVLLAQAILWLPAAPAMADLMIFPTRIVFDGRTRTAQVDLVNTDDHTATYRIGFAHRRMNEMGNLANIETPIESELFADQMIRYSPRQVVLAPGAGQAVRLLLRRPQDLPDGEYRSHLVFERVPDAPVPDASAVAGGSATGAGAPVARPGGMMDIKLTAFVNVSIPVIVRHGVTNATVAITAPHIEKDVQGGQSLIAFTVERSGNRSVYGDLTAFYTAPGGKPKLVAQANGIAVYAPYPLRHVKLRVDAEVGMPLERGRLRVEFRARPEDQRVLLGSAEASL